MAPKPLATDTNARIPNAIKASAARSDALHAAAYPAPAEPAAPDPAAPPAEPPLVAAAAPAPAPAPESLEHKLNSEKGRTRALEKQLREQNERMANLEATLAAMSTTAPVAPATPTPAELQAKRLITPEDVAAYGEEFIDVIRRAGDERFLPVVEELRGQVKTLTERLQNVGGQIQKSARDKMNDALTAAVADWKTINEDQNFLNWLALPDAYSGAIRHSLLTAAYAANDTPRVLAFFKGFLAEEAATSPRTPAPDPTLPAPPPVQPTVTLESLAAPGRAKSAAAAPAPAEKPTFTRAQVTKFYADCSRGVVYAGREAEKNQIEQQIVLAGREGRII